MMMEVHRGQRSQGEFDGKGSLRERLEAAIDSDIVLQNALERDVVNQRALARWFRRTYGWIDTEEAILSAIRRHLGGAPRETVGFGEAREILGRSHVNMRANMALLSVPKTPALQARIPTLFKHIDYSRGETLRVVQVETSIMIFIDESRREEVEEVLGVENIQSRFTDLRELCVMIPAESVWVPGVMSLMCNALSMRGISIVEFLGGSSQLAFFVQRNDAVAAFEALHSLTGSTHADSPAEGGVATHG